MLSASSTTAAAATAAADTAANAARSLDAQNGMIFLF